MPTETIVITGAFSYTGKYATRILLERGYKVRTLTFHPDRQDPLRDQVELFPYDFDHPERMRDAMRGAATLVNTYWIRFAHGKATFESAVANTRLLISAAKDAGVRRIVHVSIAKPSIQSPLGYYRGKAALEQSVMDSGLAYTILRPTVIFGREDILINNIAWFVRRFPMFGVPGDGQYGIRPIYVQDMARLMVTAAEGKLEGVVDAVGPETFTFTELVKLIAATMDRRIRIVQVPASLAYIFTRIMGLALGDVVLTWQEYLGLMDNLLAPDGPPAGDTRLSVWLQEHRETVGMRYSSEVARHFRQPDHKRRA